MPTAARLRVRRMAVLLAAGLVLAGCGDGTEPPPITAPAPTAGTEPGLPPTPTVEEPVPSPTAEGVDDDVLTEDDDGRRVALSEGEEVPLRLGGDRSWDQPRVEGAAVSLAPVEYFADPGYVEWLVLGAGPGSATVEVDGEPACGDPEACPPLTVRLTFEVGG